jgi:hypothetical protein
MAGLDPGIQSHMRFDLHCGFGLDGRLGGQP